MAFGGRYGLRGLAGQPIRPYADYNINAGSDCYLTLTFLDRFNNPVIPTAVTYRIDNLTQVQVVLQSTPLPTPTSPTIVIDIPGSVNQIGFSNMVGFPQQLNQVLITATYPDASQATEIFLYNVIALQTPQGQP